MAKHHNDEQEVDRDAELERILLDKAIVEEYHKELSDIVDKKKTDSGLANACDITLFSDMVHCEALTVCQPNVSDGPVFFGSEVRGIMKEMLFYDVLFVKHSALPPVPDRKYKNPGTLYNSLSLVAPPGERRAHLTEMALQNMYLKMSTSSASRRFGPYSTRTWSTTATHREEPVVYLSNRAFSYAEDIRAGRVSSKPCGIPAEVDTNGVMSRIVKSSKGALCLAQENIIRICDFTVPETAPETIKFPSPDVVLSGQLVYVTFTVRGTIGKPVETRFHSDVSSKWKYAFKPTLRSVGILSKAGPMAIMRNSLRKTVRFQEMALPMDDDDEGPMGDEITNDLKRLRLTRQ